MDARAILSDLLKDAAHGCGDEKGPMDDMDPKDILSQYDAYGADGQVDLSKQLRPPTPQGCGSPGSQMSSISSIATGGGSRPSSGLKSPGSTSNTRPVSSHALSRPASAQVQSPVIDVIDQEASPMAHFSAAASLKDGGWQRASDAFHADTIAAPERQRKANRQGVGKKEKEGFVILHQNRERVSCGDSVATAAAARQAHTSAVWKNFTGVVKEAGNHASIAATAAGPYLTVHSMKPGVGTIAVALVSRHKGRKVLQDNTIQDNRIQDNTIQDNRIQDKSRHDKPTSFRAQSAERMQESTVARNALAESIADSSKEQHHSTAAHHSEQGDDLVADKADSPDRWQLAAHDALAPVTQLFASSLDGGASAKTAGGIDPGVSDEDAKALDTCDAAAPSAAAHMGAESSIVDEAAVGKTDEGGVVKMSMSDSPEINYDPRCVAAGRLTVDEVRGRYESRDGLRRGVSEGEVSEEELQRIQEFLEEECDNGVQQRDHDVEDAQQLQQFQKYMQKLGVSEDKIDQFKQGRTFKIKEDTVPQFSPKFPKSKKKTNGIDADAQDDGLTALLATEQQQDLTESEAAQDNHAETRALATNARDHGSAQELYEELVLPSTHANVGDDETALDSRTMQLGLGVQTVDVSHHTHTHTHTHTRTSVDGSAEDQDQGLEVMSERMADMEHVTRLRQGMSGNARLLGVGGSPQELEEDKGSSSQDSEYQAQKRESYMHAAPTATSKSATILKKKQRHMDLFERHKDARVAKRLKEGMDAVVPEWKRLSTVITVPSARRIMLSSDSSDYSSQDDDESMEKLAKSPPLSATGTVRAGSGRVGVHVAHVQGVAHLDKMSAAQTGTSLNALMEQDPDQRVERQEKESISMIIARRQYDALYGSEVMDESMSTSWKQSGPPATSRRSKQIVAPMENGDDEEEEETASTHWSRDRRLLQAHHADRFYEALRLRHGARQFAKTQSDASDASDACVVDQGDGLDEQVRLRHILGTTATTPVGPYEANLARIRSKRESAMHFLHYDHLRSSIDDLPQPPAPRPGELAPFISDDRNSIEATT